MESFYHILNLAVKVQYFSRKNAVIDPSWVDQKASLLLRPWIWEQRLTSHRQLPRAGAESVAHTQGLMAGIWWQAWVKKLSKDRRCWEAAQSSSKPKPQISVRHWLWTQAGISIDLQLLPSFLVPTTKPVFLSFCTDVLKFQNVFFSMILSMTALLLELSWSDSPNTLWRSVDKG